MKVLAIDSKGRAVSFAETPYAVERPGPGLAVVDADKWFEASATAIRTCMGKADVDPKRVGALAVCGPAHNAALLDSSGKPVRPAIHWTDTRAAAQARTLDMELGQQILDLTLHPPLAGWTLAQFMWIKENDPESWRRAATWAVTKDYVAFKLTGELGTDTYDATGTQMYNVRSARWSPELLGLLGWSPTYNAPQVREPTVMLGRINADASVFTGLTQGTPVAVGTGDTICEALAAGAWSSGDVLLKLGSSGNVLTVADHPTPMSGRINYQYLHRDKWITVTATASGAASARWFRDAFLSGHGSVGDASGKGGYQLMDGLAATVSPGAGGLIFHPYLSGERSPFYDPDVRADFLGVSTAHSLAHFARAVFEGVAMSLRHCVDEFGEVIADNSDFSIIGGGARSTVWLSIVADILDRPLRPGLPSPAAYGAALLAKAMFNGESPQPPELQKAQAIVPDPDNVALYEDLMTIYRDSVAMQRPISHRLSQFARGLFEI